MTKHVSLLTIDSVVAGPIIATTAIIPPINAQFGVDGAGDISNSPV